MEKSPHMELLRKKDYEVLFLTDPVDEWVTQGLTEYDGKKLKAVDRGDLEVESEEEKKEKEAKKEEANAAVQGASGVDRGEAEGQGEGSTALRHGLPTAPAAW